VTSTPTAVGGRVDPGFEAVADEFEHLLRAEPAQGAAFAAYVDGRLAVDLWGGLADGERGLPWTGDTMQLIFSGTKGLVAACVLLLVERGALELDAPVASYWPDFGAGGKEQVLVRHVMSHTAGVPGLRAGFTASDLLDRTHIAAAVAAEEPFWEPGSRLAYHALTYGVICGELIRRVDGRSPGQFFAEELAQPLLLELWIGLPAALEPRVAVLRPAADFGPTYLGDEPEPLLGALFGDLLAGGFRWNDHALHQGEIPAANAIGASRSIAWLYACLAAGGELDGLRLLSDSTVRLGRTELVRGICAVTRRPYAFGVGFELNTDLGTLGPAVGAFGHTGSGGSTHGAWPEERVGYSFGMNGLLPESDDRRGRRLLAALHSALS
jgi:CubicO group peptidase (beta-lactamase class C family)